MQRKLWVVRVRRSLGAGGALGLILLMSLTGFAQYTKKTAVAHRGASAYAPEHTLAAYKLAIEMGADYVEQDLAVTRDGVLICLHDASLERTTDVEQLFPDRVSTQTIEGKTRKAWLANDFTLAEIKRLDAGSWFDKKFAGEKVPTFDEAIALIRGKAGIFPELKTPEIYAGRDVKFEELVAAALDRNGLRGSKADPKTPVILQTFGQPSARTLARIKIGVPVVLLLNDDAGFTTANSLKAWKGIVQGFGPAKSIVLRNPDFVKWAHAEGMSVTPYTFRSSDAAKSGYKDVGEEMAHYLYTLDVDAVFTDNPDKFPRK
jgi:glycerophosphoryl diester phosphodiesterase